MRRCTTLLAIQGCSRQCMGGARRPSQIIEGGNLRAMWLKVFIALLLSSEVCKTQQNTLPHFIVSPKNYDVTLCDSIEEEQNYTVVLDCAAENSHTVKWSINGKSYSIPDPRSTGSVVYSQLTYNVSRTTESQIITCTAYGFSNNSVLSTNATISFKECTCTSPPHEANKSSHGQSSNNTNTTENDHFCLCTISIPSTLIMVVIIIILFVIVLYQNRKRLLCKKYDVAKKPQGTDGVEQDRHEPTSEGDRHHDVIDMQNDNDSDKDIKRDGTSECKPPRTGHDGPGSDTENADTKNDSSVRQRKPKQKKK